MMNNKYEYKITEDDFINWLEVIEGSNSSLKKSAMYKALWTIVLLFFLVNSKFSLENMYNFYTVNNIVLFLFIFSFFIYYVLKKMNNRKFNFYYYCTNNEIFSKKYENKHYCITVNENEKEIKIENENSIYNLNNENLGRIKINDKFITLTSKNFRDFFIPLDSEGAIKIKSLLIKNFSEKIIKNY